ncbi:MAG: chemotaxis protein CheW [Alphaproteobacteria bacterium]|nr:chemotaxis protein CheW [Alphaproteobacteria bacterium]MBU0798579.1 chemotaxis protein CheW [Alphaproteobacteria bacterium]MBU0888134.1 chemotaxis protein CheW [Alphaproteobacteria bacterium]MBU1811579.1 chemotaxis protein CheW [Alphaproteobacteria bacterium]MBU2092059.1 chemotaxis protein CheW [Alphaproteobacteria bacterium]
MANDLVTRRSSEAVDVSNEAAQQYVTVFVANQMFGFPVLDVHDVLGPQRITRIPLSPPEVAGSLNLRGRIVTAVDMRRRLSLPPAEEGTGKGMSVVVECQGELYSLMVDQVGEVLNLSHEAFEHNPSTLDPMWREVSSGIYRLDKQLLVLIDVDRLLDFSRSQAA